MLTLLYVLIVLAGLWGFWITARIGKEKKHDGPMVCPLGADCKTVVNSEFSSFLGIGLENYGSLYYLIIVVSYITMTGFLPISPPDLVVFLLVGFTSAAFMFSLYLTIVQAFYLRSWCTWCLMSAMVSTIIFILTVVSLFFSDANIIPILEYLAAPIVILHLLGFALGVGGATISDVLFVRFLKDFQLDEQEDKILKIMSQVVWVGLLIVVISGVGLFLPNSEALLESTKFIVKMIVVGIIIINGAALNLIVSPKIMRIAKKDGFHIKQTCNLRKIAFALGAVSFVSWYTAFILGTLDSVPVSVPELLSFYILLVVIGVFVSQIMERLYTSKGSK